MTIEDQPFELFCLYYLGLGPGGECRMRNANQIARRFNWTVGELMQVLHRHGLHPDTVLHTDFPMAYWQVELQLRAEEASEEELRSVAHEVYERFRKSQGRRRNWLKEIEEERDDERGDDPPRHYS